LDKSTEKISKKNPRKSRKAQMTSNLKSIPEKYSDTSNDRNAGKCHDIM
jgi:hypothetical protein